MPGNAANSTRRSERLQGKEVEAVGTEVDSDKEEETLSADGEGRERLVFLSMLAGRTDRVRSPSQEDTIELPERPAQRQATQTEVVAHYSTDDATIDSIVTRLPPGLYGNRTITSTTSHALSWEEIFPSRPASVTKTVHLHPMTVIEHIRPHIHQVYHPYRQRSIHVHEHRTTFVPVTDTEEREE